jgi:hypothetical protein
MLSDLRFAFRLLAKAPGFATLAILSFAAASVQACTIFVLTDATHALFCNNEDWSNPRTRIWFVPASAGCYGRAYVGYDDGWARGGLNTAGLACDWVGGFSEEWQPGPAAQCVRGNPTERLLESCATVEEAIAFFQQHPESDFARAKLLVADRSGASAIIGARDGKLQIEPSNTSRGFGYGFRTLNMLLANAPPATVAAGTGILHACRQEGRYATKYSNVFDLKSGEIFLYPLSETANEVRFNLAAELRKGGHYYDLPQIHQQLAQAPRPLLREMRRFFLDEFPPVADHEPSVTRHLRATIEDAMHGAMRPTDYNVELWTNIAPAQKAIQADLQRYGGLTSMALVDRQTEDNRQSLLYRIEFEKAILLMRFVLDGEHHVALIHSEGAERKPGADLGGD